MKRALMIAGMTLVLAAAMPDISTAQSVQQAPRGDQSVQQAPRAAKAGEARKLFQ